MIDQQIDESWDAKIGEAIVDVPVPADLESRLLARLREEAPEPAGAANLAQPAPRAGSWKTLAASLTMAAAATVAIIVWQGAMRDEEKPQTLAELRELWHEAAQNQQPWRDDSQPTAFPVSRQVARSRAEWFMISETTVAYRLTPSESRHATYLFVSKNHDVSGLPPSPPRDPFWTQNRGIGQWREGSLVYVLIAEGPSRRYREALRRSQPGALASIDRLRRAL